MKFYRVFIWFYVNKTVILTEQKNLKFLHDICHNNSYLTKFNVILFVFFFLNKRFKLTF